MKQIKSLPPTGRWSDPSGRMRGRLAGVSKREGTADFLLISPLCGQLLPGGRSLWRGLQRFPAHQSVPQPVIYALLRQQLVVAALLLDAVAAQHQNAVRILIVVRRWAIVRVVRPFASLSRLWPTKISLSLSRALVASSSSRMQDARVLQKTRAIAKRCFCPPDSLTPRSPT